MSGIATAVVGGSVIGGVASGYFQKEATEEATGAQVAASEAAAAAELEGTKLSVEEQRRQFDAIQELLAPYVSAGETSLAQQMNLIGLGGQTAQADAIAAIEASPQFEALTGASEEAILQSASATGGLRGGNVQAALAEYRPSVLSSLIENQYSKLGQLTGVGQASATGQAKLGQQTSSNISSLLQQSGTSQAQMYGNIGTAQAQQALAKGQIYGGLASSLSAAPMQYMLADKYF